VIGQRDRRRAVFGGAAAEPVDPAGPVEQRVLRVNVEMDELFEAGFLARAEK